MAEPSGGMAAGIRAAPPEHSHRFGTQGRGAGERRTRWVVWITLVMMGGEIVAGLLFRSMALLADGWHMGTHAAALGVALFAYGYARRHASDPRYSFGTGKVGALGGFASAVGLAVVAVLVVGESAVRLAVPAAIRYDQALVVAVIGLLVNAGCVLLLRDDGAHAHADGAPHHHDHNLRGAYLHVLADALTSVFAIVALLAGRTLGWSWMDPAMGLLGGLVIARWAVGLLRETSSVLLDAELSEDRRARIRAALEGTGDARITDLHVWRVGPAHLAAIVSVTAAHPQPPDHYRHLLAQQHELAHVTVEVQQAPPAGP